MWLTEIGSGLPPTLQPAFVGFFSTDEDEEGESSKLFFVAVIVAVEAVVHDECAAPTVETARAARKVHIPRS